MKILEQHISRWALPNEEIMSWIKWDASVDFNQIIIRSETDIEFIRILNVDKPVFERSSIDRGKVVIDRDMLQISGFLGFTSTYKLVPESKRQINFKVDFIKSGKLLCTVSLDTYVIRPIISIKMERGIDVSDTTSPTQPAVFRLLNKGKVRVTDLTPFIDFNNTSTMGITTTYPKEKIPYAPEVPFARVLEQTVPRVTLKGSGNILLRMGFKFKDTIGNEYASELFKIPISKTEKRKVVVPIKSTLSGQPPIALAPIRY